MKSRLGKIARLPLEIRNELNTRLMEGDAATPLLEWINNEPSVLAVLNGQFEGQIISIKDLLAWRRGSYMEWALVRECAAAARGLSESSEDLAATGISAEHLLTVLTVQYARILNELDTAPTEELDRKLNLLRKLTNAALALRRREFQAARIEISRERLELAREKQLSKSASSRSSVASASTESTAAPQKAAQQNAAIRKPASQNANPPSASASTFPSSDLRSLSSDFRPPTSDLPIPLSPVSGFRFPVSKKGPAILTGSIAGICA